MSEFDLSGSGKVALITGGANGIGRGVADVFGRAGYALALVDIDAEALRTTVAAFSQAGFDVVGHKVDVADSAGVEGVVAATVRRWGRLDFVLNGAGIVGKMAPIERLDEADVDRVIAVNLKGPMNVCKHTVPAMRGGGVILNIASITGRRGAAEYPAYSASKAAVVALTRSLARRIGRFNIRINCMSPGSVDGTRLMAAVASKVTSQQRMALVAGVPLARVGRPSDIAHLALFLASPLASHIHGAVLTIDGGESLGAQ